MSLYGLYALISGKFSLGRKGEVTGIPARIAGAIYLGTSPIIFMMGFILGFLIGLGIVPESQQSVIGVSLELVFLFGFYFLGRMVATKGLEEQTDFE
jgi:hypothetical protein